MTDSFKRSAKDNDIANAFHEGWTAACNLHLKTPPGPPFHKAWLASEAFKLMPVEDQRRDRWAALAREDK